ncbi:thioredoxin domain-containing protein [Candidatus Daviesbacteria bacterium]|nr:thioredoxin domain-containing protein [Candidatus Daviesbacteria bacterium]
MTQEVKILTGIAVITVALVIGAVFFLSKGEKPVVIESSRLVREDSLKISTDSAKLTMVEFGDFQCPACAIAYPGIKKAISDFPGQVNFVFRHFPLSQHKNAEIAARAVEAANLQGKAWEMHDKLYDLQPEWENEANVIEIFKKYAGEFGMDIEKFASDINNDAIKQKIRNDMSDGNALGVNSTPTLFFNGEIYKKSTSYEALKAEIESKIK